jgi:hypothetical protein
MTSTWRNILFTCGIVGVAILAYSQCGPDCGPDAIDGCVSSGGLWHPGTCTCTYKSPIIIDVLGDGYRLTSAQDGVQFQFDPEGPPSQTSWTAAQAAMMLFSH